MLHARPSAVRGPGALRTKPSAARRGVENWLELLDPESAPEVVADHDNGARLLLPTPLAVGEVVSAVPAGSVVTESDVQRRLADRWDAERCCPTMTASFLRILAGVVASELRRGRKARWPIWRVVRDDGTLHPGWPLAPLYRASMLRGEGVSITRRNGHWAVVVV